MTLIIEEMKLGKNKEAADMIKIPPMSQFKLIVTKAIDSNQDGKFSKEELENAFEEILMAEQ